MHGVDVSPNHFLVFFLLLLLSFDGICSAGEQDGSISGQKKILFEDLELTISKNPDQEFLGGGYNLTFSRQGRAVYSEECAFHVREPRIVPGVPGPNCRSLLAYCYSGGAHCCMSLIIATSCGSRKGLDIIDLAHSDSEVKFVNPASDEARAMRVTDWQFAYYGVEGTDLQLSFADSPGMARLLTFDGVKWRPDTVGEFSRFYEPLFQAARQSALATPRKGEAPEITAAKAIKAAYYLLMSGKSPEEASDELRRLLPSSWKPEADKVSADIRRTIRDFNPVEVIE